MTATATRTTDLQQQVTVFDITLPNGKTARCWQFDDGSVDGQGSRWTAAQWAAGKAKMIAVGAVITESAGYAHC